MVALQGMRATQSTDEGEVLSKLSAFFGAKEPNWIQVDFSDRSGRQQRGLLSDCMIKVLSAVCFLVVSKIGQPIVPEAIRRFS